MDEKTAKLIFRRQKSVWLHQSLILLIRGRKCSGWHFGLKTKKGLLLVGKAAATKKPLFQGIRKPLKAVLIKSTFFPGGR